METVVAPRISIRNAPVCIFAHLVQCADHAFECALEAVDAERRLLLISWDGHESNASQYGN